MKIVTILATLALTAAPAVACDPVCQIQSAATYQAQQVFQVAPAVTTSYVQSQVVYPQVQAYQVPIVSYAVQPVVQQQVVQKVVKQQAVVQKQVVQQQVVQKVVKQQAVVQKQVVKQQHEAPERRGLLRRLFNR